VDSIDNLASAGADSVAAADWRRVFDEVTERISARFARPETRRTARELLVGLLSPIERKNGWWLAEHAGHASPDVQRLLRTAVWDHDGAAEDLRDLVTTRLDHPEAVFVIDETGFLEKGIGSVGAQRQYSGTAGRIENSQVGVFLTYASPHGAGVDRRPAVSARVLVRRRGPVREGRSAARDRFTMVATPPLSTFDGSLNCNFQIRECR
jgi:hypothetical protein